MKILICCSKHFYGMIEPIKKELEQKGHSIFLPNSYTFPEREHELLAKSSLEHAKWKGEMFTKGHYKIVEAFDPNDKTPKFDGLDRIK